MAETIITELHRTGAGVIEATPTVLRWSSAARTGARGDLEHELTAMTVRETVPGSEEPIEQGLAAIWEPFDLEGVWDDRFAGRGFALATYDAVARLVARIPLVRVQVDKLTFTGILTKLRVTYRTADKIGWALTLSPHVNETVGHVRPARAITAPSAPVSHHVAAAESRMAALDAARADAAGIPVRTSVFADVDAELAAMRGVTQRLHDASAAGFEADAAARLLTIGALFRSLRGSAQAIPNRFSRASTAVHVAYDSVAETLAFEEWTRTSAADARRAIWGADQATRDMDARARSRPRALHRARQGESLRRISQHYYGTPAAWQRIYEANDLSSITLLGSEELVIPEVSP